MSILFSIGAISWYSLPILRNESASHRRRIEANRLQSVERLDKRPLIWRRVRVRVKYREVKKDTRTYLADTDEHVGY